MQFRRLAEKLKWDLQYFCGYWNYIDGIPEPALANTINANLKGGSILDLGCGTANTVAILAGYTSYQGVDLSNVALRKARRRYANAKNRFVAADIVEFQPRDRFDVIVLSEVIYYIALDEVCEVLRRYQASLKEGGVFVMRIWDARLKGDFIRVISENFDIIENKPITGTELSVIVTFA